MATYEQDLKADREERPPPQTSFWTVVIWLVVIWMLLAWNKEWIIAAMVGAACLYASYVIFKEVWHSAGSWPIVVFVGLCAMAWWMD